MRESPYEVVLLVASWALLVSLTVAVVRRDERRLRPAELERAWPPASRDAALLGLSLLGAPLLGLFALVFHFFRTRSTALWPPWKWSMKGLLLGLAWAAGVVVVNGLAVTALAWALGLPD